MEVTQEIINGWKEKHKHVYKIKLLDQDIYFKTLSRADYLKIATIQFAEEVPDDFDYELATVKSCLLTEISEDELKSKPGIITILSEQIMARSGFQQVEVEEL